MERKQTDIPEGFQKTEVGVIPEDWEVKPIGETLHIKHGKSQKDVADTFGKYPILATGGIIGFANKHLYNKPSVLIGRKGTIDKPLYMNTPFWSVDTLFYSEINKGYSAIYLFYNFCSINWYAYNEASGVPSLNAKTIENILIPLPPTLAEQTAIANALSDMDALIDAQEKLIHKKRLIKQGAMQELLRPKEGWVEKELGELGTFSKGSGIKKEETQSGNIPCIRYGEIYTRHNFRVKSFFSFISENVAKNAKMIKYGDILFTGSGETIEDIGKCVSFLMAEEAYAGGDIILFSPQNMSSEFLGYLLNSHPINKQKAVKGQGDKIVHITARQLATIKLNFPPLTEQQQIAQTLSDMDTEIEQLETQLTKYKQMKAGIMQELLTGKKRLYR